MEFMTMLRSGLAKAFLLIAIAVFVTSGCTDSRSSMPGKQASVEDGSSSTYNYPDDVPDFREWCSRKSSVAEAEQALGSDIPVPEDTRDRVLKAIYVGETYPDGTAVAQWDRGAILDYGDFVMIVEPHPSAESAAQAVESLGFGPMLDTGLVEKASVRGQSAYIMKKGEVEMVADESGKATLPGMTSDETGVFWSEGERFISLRSKEMSLDELKRVAGSVAASQP